MTVRVDYFYNDAFGAQATELGKKNRVVRVTAETYAAAKARALELLPFLPESESIEDEAKSE